MTYNKDNNNKKIGSTLLNICKINLTGFTLVELVVGMGVFAMILLGSSIIFQNVIQGQSRAISSQTTQESMRYVFEVISKEMRMAKKDFDGTCNNGNAGEVFGTNVAGDALYFKNEYDECVAYINSANDRFQISRIPKDSFAGMSSHVFYDITPDELAVSNLQFYDDAGDEQEAVTIVMTLNTLNAYFIQSRMDLQTTVSNRYYLEDELISS
ncbi:MAG: type II secretion system protein [Patescibacteria group bacterium]|jgi:type II secretory pathway pseudopilin PulG